LAAFGEHFAKSGRVPAQFHRYLIEAEDSRKVGDYDMMSKLTMEDAREQINRAEKFLDLSACLKDPPQTIKPNQ
jgi:uncharacterized protein (UPF0332 family)